MRILKMVTNIVFIIAIYFMANFISFVAMGFYYSITVDTTPSFPELNNFIMENILLNMLIASVIAVMFFVLFLLVRNREPGTFFELRKIELSKTIRTLTLGAAIALLLNSVFAIIEIQRFFPQDIEMLEEVIDRGSLVMRLLSIGLIIPIFEELMYRGMIFNELRNNIDLFGAVTLQAIIFGALHGNMYQFIYVVPAGVLLALVYLWCKSLLAPILVHMGWNIMSLIMGEFLPTYIPVFVNYMLLAVGFLAVAFSLKTLKDDARARFL